MNDEPVRREAAPDHLTRSVEHIYTPLVTAGGEIDIELNAGDVGLRGPVEHDLIVLRKDFGDIARRIWIGISSQNGTTAN